MKPRATRALSLMEAVISSFLLLSCFLVIINLFHSGLRYSTQIENQQIAAMVAERQLEQMRLWSETAGASGYNFDYLSAVYGGTSALASDFSNFSVLTQVVDQTIYSSCSTFERGVAASGGLACSLNHTVKKVQVTVSWDNDTRQVSTCSLFSRPAGALASHNPIAISPTSSPAAPLPHLATLQFSATATDAFGNPIPDLRFNWAVVPRDGNGTLTVARDGSTATLQNVIMVNGGQAFTGGSLVVQATARYHGQTASATSSLVQLAP